MRLIQTPQARPWWLQALIALGKSGCFLLLFLGCQVMVSLIYSTAEGVRIALEHPELPADTASALAYDTILAKAMEISMVSNLLTLGIVAAVFLIRRCRLRRELWLAPAPAAAFGWSAGLAVSLYCLVTLVLGLLPDSWKESYSDASSTLESVGIVAFLSTAIVAPIVEEVIFRGLIFTRLRQVMPRWPAILLSAAVFGICHGEIIWVCYAFSLGVILALLAETTHSILPGMLFHVCFNATNSLMMLLVSALSEEDTAALTIIGLLSLLLATGGTAVCATMLRRALKKQPPLLPGTAGEDPAPVLQPGGAQSAPYQSAPVQPGQAQWDPDSGPGHRFPANRM